jgi:hypothetical protein
MAHPVQQKFTCHKERMSTSNIISVTPAPVGEEIACIVTFRVRQGSLSYIYYGEAALAILGGADPANYDGTRI